MSVVNTVPGTVATYHAPSSNSTLEIFAASAATLGASSMRQPFSVQLLGLRTASASRIGGVGRPAGLENGALLAGSVAGGCGAASPACCLVCNGQPTETRWKLIRAKFGRRA